MCSIAGGEIADVPSMLEVMRHRSPNGSASFRDKKFRIGMGRLSIIDLESPGLTLFNEDGVYLAFNGEIYNYQELRKEIGGAWKTNSDTEVLFRAYKKWGVKAVDKLNGMFAFAVYDGDKVFLARDIAGEKPLYYNEKPFAFASEAKALNFECKELPPAHYLIYDFKETKIKKWWNFEPKEIKEIGNKLEWLLQDSVRLRTHAHVPYGLYFSSGVDSTLLSTFHEFEHKFTYPEGDFSEEFKKVAPRIVWHLDFPVKSFSPFGLWKLAEMASKKVKVVLSGEGADELFGGYVRYLPDELNRQAQEKFPSYKSLFPYKKSVNEAGWEEFNGNMQELLRMGDRMSSAFGIENRCPFLDRRIIEFAFSLQNEEKVKGFEMKHILRKILRKRNPTYKEIEKKGFYIPVNKWIGSKQEFGKDDWLKYQENIFKKFK